jgi:multiple sugar transport system substrate-binding protein
MKTPRVRFTTVAAAAAALALATACSSGTGSSAGTSAGKPSSHPLTLMFGSSGPAETAAVQAAAAAFTKQSGITVKVIAASNLTQQLAQGFAGNSPPDVFYLDPGSFQNYAKEGVLYPYASKLPNAGDFYPVLRAAFSYKGQFICAPKDASTLALYINTQDWKQAHLTAADVPTTWAQLDSVAKKLTTGGHTGLVLDQSHSGIDEFFYQNGGSVLNSTGTAVDLSSSQDLSALSFLKNMMSQGTMKFPSQLSSGWSGEALGTNKAAMAIVGNWAVGAMQADWPKVKYEIKPLPAGPSGTKATLSFTNCWGIPKQSKNLAGAVDFVKFLTTPQQQMAFAKAFGVIPSLDTLQSQFTQAFPALAVHVQALSQAHPDVALAGDTQALAAWDSAIAQLPKNSPTSILNTGQQDLTGVIQQNG